MLTKKEQLYKNKKPKITKDEKDYLNWLQMQNFKCFVCNSNSGIEYHHITDIHRLKGKRRVHNRLVPLCYSCHRTGKNAIHSLSKEYYYENIKSLDELLNESERIYKHFLEA